MPKPVNDPDLAPIFARLENGVPSYLDKEARCRLIQKITLSVLDRAQKNNLFLRDQKGRPVAFPPGCFEAEDAVLAKLVATLDYTPVYKDFFTRNAALLGKNMAEMIPAGKLRRDWPTWNAEQRLTFLQDIAKAQCALFNHDNIRFFAPEIAVEELSAMILGQFDSGAWSLSDRVMDKKMKISQDHFDGSNTLAIAETLWHEQTHSLCQQFAAARDNGKLADYNPFSQDAETKRQRLKYNAIIFSAFAQAYAADPEENLAFRTQVVFSSSWEDNSGFLNRATRLLTKNLRGFLP